MPRKGVVARDDPAAAPFFVHSFEDNARDRDIGKAEPNRTTRIHDTQQEVEPEIGFGARGVRSWNKLDCGRLYDVAFGFFSAECRKFCLPSISSLAELLPHQKASDPISNPAVAAVKAKPSAQQQHVAALQENSALLQQTTALLQQDSITLDSLRQSVADGHVDVKKISSQITDEHEDVKKISGQISKLIAKVDSLQNAITPEVTSSISTRHARYRLSRTGHKRMARQPRTVGPVSLGGAPLTLPATTPAPQG